MVDYSYALNVLRTRRFERIPRLLVSPIYPAQIQRASTSPSYRLTLMRTIHFGANDLQSSCSSSGNVPSTLCSHSTCVSLRHHVPLAPNRSSHDPQVFHLLFPELLTRSPCARSFGGDLAQRLLFYSLTSSESSTHSTLCTVISRAIVPLTSKLVL